MSRSIHTIAIAGVALAILGAIISRPSQPLAQSAVPQPPRNFGWQEQPNSLGTFQLKERLATLTLKPKTELFDGRSLLSQTHGVDQRTITLLPWGDHGTYATITTPKGTIHATCLLADGTTVITRDEYLTHQNRRAALPETLWGYFLGQTDLRQWQCLWIELTSLGNFSTQEFESLISTLSQRLIPMKK
ncbi:MAG: hypothetical protein HC919_08680 [Oscillatoriales cyanobacterium SM2_2_1]|nr:hypothetical protein [Oscillatoriales cyanobacterium SM2_2_1]